MEDNTEYTPEEMADLRQKLIGSIGDREPNEFESWMLEDNNLGKVMWTVDSELGRQWVEKGGLREMLGINAMPEPDA